METPQKVSRIILEIIARDEKQSCKALQLEGESLGNTQILPFPIPQLRSCIQIVSTDEIKKLRPTKNQFTLLRVYDINHNYLPTGTGFVTLIISVYGDILPFLDNSD